MKNQEYIRHAHRKAVLQHLQRYLRENYLEFERSPKEVIFSEDVFVSDRLCTQDALLDVMELLLKFEKREQTQLDSFELKKRDSIPLEDTEVPHEPNSSTNTNSDPLK